MTQPVLVLLVPGIAYEAAAELPFLGSMLSGRLGVPRLHRDADLNGAPVLAHATLDAMRELGLDVDARSTTLRPAWRGDDAVLHELESRPAGVADVTILELTDPARAAALEGPGSAAHRQAVRRCDDHARIATAWLRRSGHPPELFVIGEGPLRTVDRTVDPRRYLDHARRRLGLRPTNARIAVAPNVAIVDVGHAAAEDALRADVARAFARHARALGDAELRAHGLPSRTGRIVVVPNDGVAFGDRQIRGVMPLVPTAPRDCGFAVVPTARVRRHDMDLRAVVARLLARCTVLADAITRERARSATDASALSLADVEPVFVHDSFEVVEDGADVEPLA
jgi:hypothetical protein